MKIGPVDPEIICLKWITKINNKLTQAEHVACEAGMPRGLNKLALCEHNITSTVKGRLIRKFILSWHTDTHTHTHTHTHTGQFVVPGFNPSQIAFVRTADDHVTQSRDTRIYECSNSIRQICCRFAVGPTVRCTTNPQQIESVSVSNRRRRRWLSRWTVRTTSVLQDTRRRLSK